MFKFILPSFNFNVERWKWNKEYRVYVSNMGHFRDEYKRPLGVRVNQQGYLLVKTCRDFKKAHRLVMLTWRPIPNAEDLTVDHLDHNKRNNALTNLEWVTGEENLRRAKADYIRTTSLSQANKTITLYYAKDRHQNIIESFTSKKEIITWLKTKSPMASMIKGNHWSDDYLLSSINTRLKTGGKFLYFWQEAKIPVA
jgi:hypothetical protein